jgi:hypothetical protein
MNAKKDQPEEKKDETSELLDDKKEIAPVAPKDVTVPGNMQRAPGTESITGEDTTFPRYKLLQATSAEVESGEGNPGVFKHSLTEEQFDRKEIIPLCLLKTRVMFNEEDRKGAPICRSADLVHGSGCDCGCENHCKECAYQGWEQGMPPKCSLVYNYPCLTPDEVGKTALPTLISFMKASTQAALKLNTVVQSSFPPAPFWNHVWEISCSSKKFKKGSAYVVNVKQLRETTEEERKWCATVFNHCVAGKTVDVEYDAD